MQGRGGGTDRTTFLGKKGLCLTTFLAEVGSFFHFPLDFKYKDQSLKIN